MVFKFASRKAKPKRKKYKRRKKSIPKSQYSSGDSQMSQKIETKLSQSLETNETNQILARLDVMMGFLREHHGIIKK